MQLPRDVRTHLSQTEDADLFAHQTTRARILFRGARRRIERDQPPVAREQRRIALEGRVVGERKAAEAPAEVALRGILKGMGRRGR